MKCRVTLNAHIKWIEMKTCGINFLLYVYIYIYTFFAVLLPLKIHQIINKIKLNRKQTIDAPESLVHPDRYTIRSYVKKLLV